MLEKILKNLITHTLLLGLLYITATLESKLVFSYKPKHAVIQQLYTWHYALRIKTHAHKHLCTNDSSSFSCTSSKLETIQMSFKGGMIKYTVVPWSMCSTMLYREILFSNQKEQTIGTHSNLDESPFNNAWWKNRILRDYIHYDLIYISFLKWQNYRAKKQIHSLPELARGGKQVVMILKG